MSDPSVVDLTSALLKAEQDYEEAKREESIARNRCTDRLNKLNEAQKAFGAYVSELVKKAPIDSDWGQTRRQTGTILR